MKKDISCKWKKTGVTALISDKTDFKTKVMENQDGGIGRHTAPPHTSKRRTTTIKKKKKKNQN